ncbi:MAG: hypothetical protein E6R04_06245 [Spirochaetes bacterium]|nr:MAG: hypothetical protein E6R04_06245 [Spirochaetota bacterium]
MTPRALRPYQTEAANAVESTWNEGLHRVSVVLPTGTGKMLSHSTLVPTPSGIRNHGDLRVGDEVFHPSGVPVTITHTHPQGVVDVWRITFSDKSSVLAGKEHLWKVWRRRRKPKLMTTLELASSSLVDLADNGAYMWRIPMTEPVVYPTADLPIDPYVMGALIANGYLAGKASAAVKLTTPDTEVHERVLLSYPDATVREYGNNVPYLTFPMAYGFAFHLRDMDLNVHSADKFIPQRYLMASVEQRIGLLKGLMDGDGSSRGGGRRSILYHTTSRKLAEDVQRLVWSLGGTATLNSANREKVSSGTEFTIHILLPSSITPWHSTRKHRDEHPRKVFEPHRSIVSVEYAGKEDCQCITVENPDGLYLVGEEHIVTHNSTVIAEVATRARKENKRVLLLAHRAELLDQMADAVHAVDPSGQDVGIVAADRDDHAPDIVAASFQTLARSPKRLAALGKRDVILADECFPAGTRLNDGRAIDTLRVGDTVDSWNENEGRVVRRRVTQTFKSVPSNIVRVRLSNEDIIHCTPGHPFLTAEGTWTPAIDLAGNCIVHQGPMGGCTLHVSEVTILDPGYDGTFDGACPDGHVYNIEVDETHTYLIERGYVVHNCHHISAPTYLKVLEDLGAMDDATGVNSCGFTATMYRDDGKALGEVWSDVVFERDIVWAIQNGFLIPPKGKTVAIPALNQLSAIKTMAGDYRQNELAEVMGASVDSTVDAILRHCPNAAMIVFAVSVEHARTLAEKLSANGIPSRDVTGAHKRDYREEAYSDFREGRLNCLVTVQVLTEGADFPRCDTVVMARPTRSRVLFCFDSETEILTPRGWVNGMHLSDGDEVAQWNPDTEVVSFTTPLRHFTRPVEEGEKMVSLDTPSTSIRVTENHRVYYRPHSAPEHAGWRVSEAGELALKPQRQVVLPSAGRTVSDGIALTDDEIRFIAWVTTVGTLAGTHEGARISQSKPAYVAEIRDVIAACGFKCDEYTSTDDTNFGPRTHPLHTFTISKGRPRGRDAHLRGWEHLEEWMFNSPMSVFRADGNREVQRRWEAVSEKQWDVFMDILNKANGANNDLSKLDWTPRSLHIAISNKPFADWVQSMCVRHGWSTSLSKITDRLWRLHAKKINRRHVGSTDGRPSWTFDEPRISEQVWCVTVPSGAVVTRRLGKASILGNCQMVGRAVRPYTDPVTGLVKTDATVLDLTGVVRDIKLASLTDLFPEAKQQFFDDSGNDKTDDEAFVDELLGRTPPEKERKGRIDLEDVDLIDSSAKAHKALWLRTGPVNPQGDDFAFMPLKTGGEYIFIYPPINRVGAEMVMLGRVEKNGGTSFVTNTNGVPLRGTLTQAMDAAEVMAGPSNYIGVKAGWRRDNIPPSDAQINLGNNLGIPGASEMSRGALSDAISVHFAQRMFAGIAQRYPYVPPQQTVMPAQP